MNEFLNHTSNENQTFVGYKKNKNIKKYKKIKILKLFSHMRHRPKFESKINHFDYTQFPPRLKAGKGIWGLQKKISL